MADPESPHWDADAHSFDKSIDGLRVVGKWTNQWCVKALATGEMGELTPESETQSRWEQIIMSAKPRHGSRVGPGAMEISTESSFPRHLVMENVAMAIAKFNEAAEHECLSIQRVFVEGPVLGRRWWLFAQNSHGRDMGKCFAGRRRTMGVDLQETEWQGIMVRVNISFWRKIPAEVVRQEMCLKRIRQTMNHALMPLGLSVMGRRGDPRLCAHIGGRTRPILKLDEDLQWEKLYGWSKWRLEPSMDDWLTGMIRTTVARHGRGVRQF
jgi:hypothetical protein